MPEPRVFLRVLRALFPLLLWETVWAVAAGLYYFYLEPRGAPKVVTDRNYASVLQAASTALALLLVFRTNSSYARWLEGRQLLGAMLNCQRNLARIAGAGLRPGPARDAIVRLTAALTPAAASFLLRDEAVLRELCGWGGGGGGAAGSEANGGGCAGDGGSGTGHGGGPLRRSATPPGNGPPDPPVLTADELAMVERAAAERGVPGPIAVSQAISLLLARSGADPITAQAAEGQLTAFDNVFGGCQRLASSPIPLAYTRHSSRFLVAYLMLLPVILLPSLGWITVVAVILLTFFLGGIDNIGIQIENPLRVLPMRRYAAAYRDETLGMAGAAGDCERWADGVAFGGGGVGGAGGGAVGAAGDARPSGGPSGDWRP